MRHLAPQPAARLKAFRRTVFFGIERLGEERAENDTHETAPGDAHGTSPEVHTTQATSGENPFPLDPTGDLAEVLGAMRAFSLQGQLGTPQDPENLVSGEDDRPFAGRGGSHGRTSRPPTLPSSTSIPGLSNDWEIKNADD